MKAIQFKTAKRSRARLRLGIAGISGSGKTMGALKLALGIASDPSKIFLMDSERRSAELYAHLGEFQTWAFEDNFGPEVYTEVIHAAEDAGAEVVIIDSLSHAWDGVGGALDKVDAKGGSFSGWKDVTPKHRALVDAMLQSPCHIIATMRVKTEYVVERDERSGKNVPRKVGLAPVQKQGMEYEFTAFIDVNDSHIATASKDRTQLLDGKQFTIDERLGKSLLEWLNTGDEAPPAPPKTDTKRIGKPPVCKALCARYEAAETVDDIDAVRVDALSYEWGEKGLDLLASAEQKALDNVAKLAAYNRELDSNQDAYQEPEPPKAPPATTPAPMAPATISSDARMTFAESAAAFKASPDLHDLEAVRRRVLAASPRDRDAVEQVEGLYRARRTELTPQKPDAPDAVTKLIRRWEGCNTLAELQLLSEVRDKDWSQSDREQLRVAYSKNRARLTPPTRDCDNRNHPAGPSYHD